MLIYRKNTGTREASFRRGLELLALRSILMNQPLNKVFLDRDMCKERLCVDWLMNICDQRLIGT